MSGNSVKEQLILATIKLLTESDKPDRITARQIISEAKVNLAMINYYFHSKNELLNVAVGRIMEERANALKVIYEKDILPKDKLIEFLTAMTELSMEYIDIVRPAMSYSLLEGDMEPPSYILPIIRECYESKRTETECRLAALQLISVLQIIFFRSEQFTKYTGIDISVKEERSKLIQTIVGLYIS